ncbi:PIN domain-containing protein [Actinokineospora globicatena]|uniref:PIN domain-containing protein n=1 Tax=Actinokineospora globicatena TaxID=103729 RepID=UPI0020A4CF72|nr:PIN domain-containing protein [Actinokineospora globicatena]MCP2301362.1 PIN domain-containing protein [Actinokineospora globicatena]GLW76999.1 PIN domain-containing protein [Actinokineospora globicatena]GLW83833.1 PIN domain-containing protein [Actinokineospora globicatena]
MYPAFLDTCVLLKPYVCDTLLTIAESGLFRPLWSIGVLDELARNLAKRGLSEAQVSHRIEQMTHHFSDANVTGYEHLVPAMENDPKDRHVLAAAVRGGAASLVTENLKDFPKHALDRYGIAAVHQDEFLQDQLDLSPRLVSAALQRQVSRHRKYPRSVDDLLDVLGNEGNGCPGFAAEARHVSAGGMWRS